MGNVHLDCLKKSRNEMDKKGRKGEPDMDEEGKHTVWPHMSECQSSASPHAENRRG